MTALHEGQTKAGLPVALHADAASFEKWLAVCGATTPGVWLMFAKKGSETRTLSRQEAIDAALCEVDRRPERNVGRALLPPPLHAASAAFTLVAGQPSAGDGTDRSGADARCRLG